MGRTKIREHIFKLLFIREFNTSEEMPEQVAVYLEQLEDLREQDQAYMEEKFHKISEMLPELDEKLNTAAKGWKTSRMSKVDVNILRLALYEMEKEEAIPVKVSIDEAVKLAKKYGGDESASFINGVLGGFAKE